MIIPPNTSVFLIGMKMARIIFLVAFILGSRLNGYSEAGQTNPALEKEFEEAPYWAGMSSKEVPKAAPLLMRAIVKISAMPEPELRKFVEIYLSKRRPDTLDVYVWSKIYILNRYYFAVPQYESRPNFKFFGGWGEIPRIDQDTVNILWPLEKAADGHLLLTGAFRGYFGPEYRALEEVDFFSAKYGVRSVP